jgi:hypothetical protein
MSKFIKVQFNKEPLFINIDNITTIKVDSTKPTDKDKHTYRIKFIDGSYIENVVIDENDLNDLHLR